MSTNRNMWVKAPAAYVERVVRDKCLAVTGDVVLAADTTVDVDGVVFAKPDDDDDARRMLRLFRVPKPLRSHGRRLLRRRRVLRSFVVSIEVVFADLSESDIEEYVASGEPMGKAGRIRVQGRGAGSGEKCAAACRG